MIRGSDLKRMINMIPDDAGVTLNGNWNVNIESVTVDSGGCGGPTADLKLTDGFSLVKDDFVSGLYDKLRSAYESKG